MASATTAHADAKTATPHTAEKTPEKANTNLLLAMLAADWVIGDKHHYADIRHQAGLVLAELGKDGEAAKARLDGLTGDVPTTPVPHGPESKPAAKA